MLCVPFQSTTFRFIVNADLPLRLVGSRLPYAGRVEVRYAGVWGVVCPRLMDGTVLKVICRQLGFEDVMGDGRIYIYYEYLLRKSQLYGDDTKGPFWLTKVYCYGNESNLSQCKIDNPGKRLWCSHGTGEALELMCRPKNFTPRKLPFEVCHSRLPRATSLYLCSGIDVLLEHSGLVYLCVVVYTLNLKNTQSLRTRKSPLTFHFKDIKEN